MTKQAETNQQSIRIAKAIARAGVCSRREAEKYIENGRVSLNGKTLTSPAINISPKDKVLVDGKPLPDLEPARLWRFHKPQGLVTTSKDEKGRKTIFSALPKDMPRTITIGRLDINTEGLLLLTNDGELARHLELPSTGWLRRYKVRAKGKFDAEKFESIKNGITIDGIKYGAIETNFIREQGSNCWFSMALREGKNREIKRITEHLGLTVNRLIRLSYGPFMLGDLKEGETEEIKAHIIADQLGPELAQKFNLKPSTKQAKSKGQQKRKGKPSAGPGQKNAQRKQTSNKPTRKKRA